MKRWRAAALVGLLALVAAPVAVPFAAWLGRQERILALAGNTLTLVAGTVALALPAGAAAAVLLYRTDLPLRRTLRFLVVLTLFVPLPLLITAWQAALGGGGILPLAAWLQGNDRPWAAGMGPAIWIHAQWALPWVVVIVGHGLRWVEPELEEDALLAGGRWRTLLGVTLPRGWGVLLAAAVWVALQTAGEVAVTDLMLVRTAAEEVFTEFWLGGPDAQARALAAVLPLVALMTAAVYWLWSRLEKVLSPPAALLRPAVEVRLGAARWPAFAAMVAGLATLTGVPLASLVLRTGQLGWPPEWSAAVAGEHLDLAARRDGWLLLRSLATVFLSGAITAATALVLCWLALGSPWFRTLLLFVTALLWSVPGPLLGVGLKAVIMALVTNVPVGPLSAALYSQPSPVPVVWAHLLRFLPGAVVALWPVVRMLPRDQRDALRLDGASPLQQLHWLAWPVLARPWLAVVVVVAALAIGEVGAVTMRVETVGWETFARVLWDRMHYGLEADVTAPCVLLVLLVAVGGCLARLAVTLTRRFPAAHPPPPPVPR